MFDNLPEADDSDDADGRGWNLAWFPLVAGAFLWAAAIVTILVVCQILGF